MSMPNLEVIFPDSPDLSLDSKLMSVSYFLCFSVRAAQSNSFLNKMLWWDLQWVRCKLENNSSTEQKVKGTMKASY